ncbi:Putative FAD-binding domain, FAD/NAD(P)-binding domain superfamily [Septoria linicola]|uniref:FAD-binding domain, FAD/NAD(P)-binding domain superfamily n=1 Tax=Septoria linicola TaxID=215465 RepID=A0A9Q9AGZ2_9PEZI|nr:putative FAD-binding domain, FAD/NAD(P)-binding domain superfamily [Septoria linicola]USW48982.1 Putative FAD-binding domain, FAD/NAD(P)-binding domain superfamily [Septoria linicola]
MNSSPSVLISGAGIAGSVAAFFLARSGARVTVVERYAAPRAGGQAVDVRGHGISVLQRMGVLEAACRRATHEAGVKLVDSKGRASASFPVEDGKGFTGAIEITRDDLASILYEATKHEVRYCFGDCISTMVEDADGVHVTFRHGLPACHYGIVIGADGWQSTTRAMAFGTTASIQAVRPLEQWVAWFTIPRMAQDDAWARWYAAAGRRMILLRPDTCQTTGVSLWISTSSADLRALAKASIPQQKAFWKELFVNIGWQESRILDGLHKAEDFHTQEIVQVKMDHLYAGHVALIGDSGCCPCPISGMGTTVALVSAYVLAGELSQASHDYRSAFETYEEKMRPFVNQAQKLAPCAPGMITLRSSWSVRVFHALIRIVAWTGIVHLIAKRFKPPATAMALPLYQYTSRSSDRAR